MRLLGRLLILPFGLVLAIPAGLITLLIGAAREPAVADLAAAIGAAVLDLLLGEIHPGGMPDAMMAELAFGLWALATVLLVVPPTLTALLGEVLGARSFTFYGGLCGLLTAALPWLARGQVGEGAALLAEGRITALLFVTGAVAGLVHWLVAGRSAGILAERAPPAPAPSAAP